jgi:hypothetical protein
VLKLFGLYRMEISPLELCYQAKFVGLLGEFDELALDKANSSITCGERLRWKLNPDSSWVLQIGSFRSSCVSPDSREFMFSAEVSRDQYIMMAKFLQATLSAATAFLGLDIESWWTETHLTDLWGRILIGLGVSDSQTLIERDEEFHARGQFRSGDWYELAFGLPQEDETGIYRTSWILSPSQEKCLELRLRLGMIELRG